MPIPHENGCTCADCRKRGTSATNCRPAGIAEDYVKPRPETAVRVNQVHGRMFNITGVVLGTDPRGRTVALCP